ncbi:MAG: hypothetical protein O8C64_09560 [Candidatus Methanoperedens sp.]|nr:hypothetical protein [Candidatus Methanoperedens sp.]
MGAEVKRMADLLRSGAAMLQETCPVCATPLFRLGKDTFCPKCNRPVAIVKSAEEEVKVASQQVLDNLDQAILEKIAELNAAIKNEHGLAPLRELGEAVKTYLSVLDQVRKLRSA